jgi:hypothetical protein
MVSPTIRSYRFDACHHRILSYPILSYRIPLDLTFRISLTQTKSRGAPQAIINTRGRSWRELKHHVEAVH